MSVVGIPFLTVMGLSAAAAVLTAGGRAVREPSRTHLRRSVGSVVVRFRVPLLVGGVVALAVIAIPSLDLRLGLPSGASKPKSDTAHKAYDLTTKGFGVGFNGPLLIVTISKAASPNASTQLVANLKKENDVASVAAQPSVENTVVVQLIPRTGPNDPATADLVHAIRRDRTSIEGDTGATILVGGTTASNIDVSSKLSSALPVFLTVVVGLVFLLLTFAFRTILVPIKSIVGFLMSFFAAFGVEVAVFQWGWGKSLLGIEPSETISYLPIIHAGGGLRTFQRLRDLRRLANQRAVHPRRRRPRRRATRHCPVGPRRDVRRFDHVLDLRVVHVHPGHHHSRVRASVRYRRRPRRLRRPTPARTGDHGHRCAQFWYHPKWFAKYVPDPDIEGEQLTHEMAAAPAIAHAAAPDL
jgi:RND superfamily putative drug exporter